MRRFLLAKNGSQVEKIAVEEKGDYHRLVLFYSSIFLTLADLFVVCFAKIVDSYREYLFVSLLVLGNNWKSSYIIKWQYFAWFLAWFRKKLKSLAEVFQKSVSKKGRFVLFTLKLNNQLLDVVRYKFAADVPSFDVGIFS